MTVDAHTGEIVESHLSATDARTLTDQIRSGLATAYDRLIEAWQGRADLALGYESWEAYCAGEFTDGRMVRLNREQRREVVATMRNAGMSTRAIGTGLGVSKGTVDRDLSTAPSGAVPGTITGLDGKTRPSTRPPAQPSPPLGPVVDKATGEITGVTPETSREDLAKAAALAASLTAQLGDARYLHLFASKMKRSFELLILDPERVAQLASADDIRMLEDGARAMAEFVAKVTSARNVGLRVVKGDSE